MSKSVCVACSNSKYGFSYLHFSGECKKTAPHHDRNLFSVVMPINGKLDYEIEGKCIRVTPYDILLVGNNELHRSIVNRNEKYEYLLLMVNLDFFIKNNCTEFSEMVFNRSISNNNVIPADTVIKSSISEIFMQIDRYAREKEPPMSVICGRIIELLYHLNQHVIKSDRADYSQKKISDILAFINENITERLTLDDIAKHFYLTKQYLCKMFKKNTGYTINRYITYKRIALVREAHFNGMTLSEACYKAGFNDYSSFYRAYSKITNESPRKSLLQKK